VAGGRQIFYAKKATDTDDIMIERCANTHGRAFESICFLLGA
jgi:hypothetical protein